MLSWMYRLRLGEIIKEEKKKKKKKEGPFYWGREGRIKKDITSEMTVQLQVRSHTGQLRHYLNRLWEKYQGLI